MTTLSDAQLTRNHTNPQITATVAAIGQMHFEGNVIPHTWYKHIIFANGKADVNAILILAEIVYWYRPTIERDEATGQITGIRKKFKADLLQRSLQSFADQFGLTKRQVQDAIGRLVELKVIRKELRTVDTAQGKIGNVLFLEPVVETLQQFTYTLRVQSATEYEPPPSNQRNSSYDETYEGARSNVGGHTSDRATYTGISSEISSKIPTEKGNDGLQPSAPDGAAPLAVESEVSSDQGPDWQLFLEELCMICHGHKEIDVLSKKEAGTLRAEGKKIRDAGFGIEDLRDWFRFHWFDDWRWKKDQQRPKPSEVRSKIPILRANFDDDPANEPPRKTGYNVAIMEGGRLV